MGGYLSTFTKLIWAKKEIRILILGLVGACAGMMVQDKRLITNVGQCRQDDVVVQVKGTLMVVYRIKVWKKHEWKDGVDQA